MDAKSIGGLLLGTGLISSVLYFMDMNLRILMWVDNWGEGTGWGIRAGLIAVGAAVLFLGPKGEPESD